MSEYIGWFNTGVWSLIFLVTAIRFAQCIRMVPNRKEYIVERLGRYHRTLGPGFHILIPFFDRVAYFCDLREESMEVPPQECFTADNVKVEVDGVIYISMLNSKNASYGVTDYRRAAVSLAQTTTRSVIGTLDLDRTFEERDAINSRVVHVLSEVGQTWGIRVHRYEVKNIVPPATVRDAMERQMGAERERRALLARSEGQKQAQINSAEGQKQELINRSEGEMQRRINVAEGQAQEILTIAQATAESIARVAASLSVPGGSAAMRLQLGQRYLTRLRGLARPTANVYLGADLTNVESLLEDLGLPASDEDPPLRPTRTLAAGELTAPADSGAPRPAPRPAGPPASLRRPPADEA